MCRKIRNDALTRGRPFIGGRWALKDWEYVIDSRGNYIGCIEYNKFVPLGE